MDPESSYSWLFIVDAHRFATFARRQQGTSTGCQILKDATATFIRVVGARRQTQGTRGISNSPVIDNLSRYPDNRSPRLWRTVVQIETELELGRIRHEAGMPGRIEHDFNMNFLDTGARAGSPRRP
jgi:hypothetical protein